MAVVNVRVFRVRLAVALLGAAGPNDHFSNIGAMIIGSGPAEHKFAVNKRRMHPIRVIAVGPMKGRGPCLVARPRALVI